MTKQIECHKGKIVDISGSWSSGIASVTLEDEDGSLSFVAVENPTFV